MHRLSPCFWRAQKPFSAKVLLLALCLATRVNGFVFSHVHVSSSFSRSRLHASLDNTPRSVEPPNNSVDIAVRFHSDMRRVLRSRSKMCTNTILQNEQLQRVTKPKILDSDTDGAQLLISMLWHMIKIGIATEESYQIVLKVLVNRGRLRWKVDDKVICAADAVTPLLAPLWQIQDHTPLTTDTCDLVLQIYASCATPRGERTYAQRAQKVLETMEQRNIPITAKTLMHVVQAWSWQQENYAASDCSRMAQSAFNRLLKANPDIATLQASHNCLLEAWSKSSDPGSEERTEEILNRMIGLHDMYPESMYPTAQSFACCVLAWAKSKRKGAAGKAITLLETAYEWFEAGKFRDGKTFDLIAFNGVLGALRKNGSARSAEKLLFRMISLAKSVPSLRPDNDSFNMVLGAYADANLGADTLQKVRAIVDYMEKFDTSESKNLRPNAETYICVLRAYAQSFLPGSSIHAAMALEKLQELWDNGDRAVEPACIPYNMVLFALARDTVHPTKRAEWSSKVLEMARKSELIHPNQITYTTAIDSLRRSNTPQAADLCEKILYQALDAYDTTRDPSLKPKRRMFGVCVQAMTATPTLKNFERARDILMMLIKRFQETGDEELRPHSNYFNSILNCATSFEGSELEKEAVFKVAANVYDAMRDNNLAKRDKFTYSNWIKCCGKLLRDEHSRNLKVAQAFEECKRTGNVSAAVINRLVRSAYHEVSRALLELPADTPARMLYDFEASKVPREWSRNAGSRPDLDLVPWEEAPTDEAFQH